jgi:type II secretory pathway component PulJ
VNDEIMVRLGLNSSAFQEGMKSATRATEGFQAKLMGPLNAVKGFGAALGGAFALNTLQGITDHAEKLRNLAEGLNVSTTELQKFQNAMEFSGVSSETATKALTKFTSKINSAAGGSGEVAEAFAKIGVSIQDSGGKARGTMEILGDVADAFSEMEDKTERSRIAVELFGKQGLKMVAALSQGREEMERTGSIKHIISEEALESLDQMGDDLKTLFDTMKGQGAEAVGVLAPLFSTLFRGFNNLIKNTNEDLVDFFTLLRVGGTAFAEAEKTEAPIIKRKDGGAGLAEKIRIETERQLSLTKERKALEAALLEYNLAQAGAYEKVGIATEIVLKLEKEIADLEAKGGMADLKKADEKRAERLKKLAELEKFRYDLSEKTFETLERIDQLKTAEKETVLEKTLGRVAVLRERISHATEFGDQFQKDSQELQKLAIEASRKQLEIEQAKTDKIKNRIAFLEQEKELAGSNKDRVEKLQKEIEEKNLALIQRRIELIKKAGDESLKLQQLQGSLKEKTTQLATRKSDRYRFTSLEEAAAIGYQPGQSAEFQNQLDILYRVLDLEKQATGLRQVDPEQSRKLFEEADKLRATLSPKFFTESVINPFKELETEIAKLTEQIKIQNKIAAKAKEAVGEPAKPEAPKQAKEAVGEPAKPEAPKQAKEAVGEPAKPEAPKQLTIEEMNAEARAQQAARIRGGIILENQQRAWENAVDKQRMDNAMKDLFPDGFDVADPLLEAKMEEIRLILSSGIKVKPVNGP